MESTWTLRFGWWDVGRQEAAPEVVPSLEPRCCVLRHAPCRSVGAPEAVSCAPYGLDAAAGGAQLTAQPLQVHVHGASLDVRVRLPDRLEQLRAALHAAFALDQGMEQLELSRCEVDFRAVHKDPVGHLVDQDRSGAEPAAGGEGRGAETAEDGAHP